MLITSVVILNRYLQKQSFDHLKEQGRMSKASFVYRHWWPNSTTRDWPRNRRTRTRASSALLRRICISRITRRGRKAPVWIGKSSFATAQLVGDAMLASNPDLTSYAFLEKAVEPIRHSDSITQTIYCIRFINRMEQWVPTSRNASQISPIWTVWTSNIKDPHRCIDIQHQQKHVGLWCLTTSSQRLKREIEILICSCGFVASVIRWCVSWYILASNYTTQRIQVR